MPAFDLQVALKAALTEGKFLRITYRGRGDQYEAVERDIEVYSFDERYIDAFCRLRQDPRCFRVDRIVDAELLAETFDIDPAIESIVGAHGWANRTTAWRRARMQSVLDDAACDRLFLQELREFPDGGARHGPAKIAT